MDTPTFATPPIIELVLGVQFSKLERLTAGHYGLFWKSLGSDWPESSDRLPLEDQFELFDASPGSRLPVFQLRLEPLASPGRLMIEHKDKDRLIQIQPTRFHLNWRKQVGGVYLSYKHLIAEFEAMYAAFAAFVERERLGRLDPNQWELTYIDAFPKGEHWQTPADWSRVLPGLFGKLYSLDGLALSLERRAAEWSYAIPPDRGRLHIAAHLGRSGEDQQESLLLNMTARGPTGSNSIRAGLDLGHEVAVGAFLRVVESKIQQSWGAES